MDPAARLHIFVTANTASAQASLAATDAQLKKTAVSAKATTGSFGKISRSVKGMAGAVGVTLGAAGLAKAIVGVSRKAAEFEQQMSSLGAVAEANTKQMGRLEKQAVKMGAATQYSATEAAAAQIELAKGGMSVKQIMGGGLKSALALAAAGELELAEAAETTVNVMGLFNLRAKDSAAIADMLATAANRTTADVSDFAMSLKMGGAVAKQAGYDLNNTVQVLEALADAGIRNSDAGTSMKAAMIQLLNPTAKQSKLAKQLGLEWSNQNGELKNAVQISRMLRVATDDMTKAERTKAFAVLAGTDGFRTLAALYDTGAQKLKSYGRANAEQGTAAEVARKKMDNLEGDLEELSGAWETLQLKVGGPVNEALRKIVQTITEVVRAAANLKMEDVTRTWEKYKDTVTITATAIGMVVAAMAAYKTSLAITGAINAVRNAQLALNLAMTANPVGLVVAALAALGVGLFVAYKKVDWFRDAVDAVWKVVRGGAEKLIAFFRTHWAKILPIVAGPVGLLAVAVIKHWDRIKSAVSDVVRWFKGVPGSLGDVWGKIKDIFRDGANAVIDMVNSVIDVVNHIPGVEIKHVGRIDNPDNTYRYGRTARRLEGKQRGGQLFGGAPSGDSIPALLERGEYVLNRKAVQKIGARRLDQINFGAAPRFQVGGFLGDAVGKAAGVARDLLGRGASFFLKQLPKPDLPAPFTNLGPWLIEHVTKWIKGKTKRSWGAGADLGDAPASLRAAMELAQQMGLTITATTGGRHAKGSWHYAGRAFDASNGTGPTAEMMRFALAVVKRWGKSALEIFYNPLGWYIKNGQVVQGNVDDNHWNHVHVAMQKGGAVPGLDGRVDRVAGRAWKRAAPLFGRSAGSAAPLLYVAKGLAGREGAVGEVKPTVGRYGRMVYMDRNWAKLLVRGNNYAEASLLHEWAHVFQRAGLKRWESEGGATAFQRFATPLVFGNGPGPWPRGYKGFAERVMREHGMGWVRRGQFARGVSAKDKLRRFRRGGMVDRALGMARGAWSVARGMLPPGTPAPRFKVGNRRDPITTAGGTIVIPRRYAKALGSTRRTADGDFIRSALVHEFAHLAQAPGVWGDWRESEGGASWWERLVAPMVYARMGIPFGVAPLPRSYRRALRSVMARHDKRWALMGQFGVGARRGGSRRRTVSGRVSYFGGGSDAQATASGLRSSKAGLALNLNPGSDSGWNNETTQGWMAAARAGKPVYGRVTIQGKSATLPIIDLGPAGWTGRAIDVTEAGIRKMGFSPANFPTDAQGTVQILGAGAKAVKAAGKASKGAGPMSSAWATGKMSIGAGWGGSTLAGLRPGELSEVEKRLPQPVRRLLRMPGVSGADRLRAANLAVSLAGETEGSGDDRLALEYRMSLNRRRLAGLRKRVAKINRQLRKRMSPKQRDRLLQQRDRLLGNVDRVSSELSSDSRALSDLPAGGILGDVGETASGALGGESMGDVVEQLRQIKDELKRENDRADAISSMSSRAAVKVLADVMSGQIASFVTPVRSTALPIARY